MRALYFDKGYKAQIRTGAKTQTIRCWKRPMVKLGETVKTNVDVTLLITACDQIALAALTDEDAIADGFPNAHELRARLDEYYAEKSAPYYRVRFSVAEDHSPQSALAFA